MTSAPAATAPPARFRAAPARNRRLGRALRVVAGVNELDEALMARIGRALTERDEPGARLAEAMRTRAPGRVTHADVRAALGGAPLDQTPPALRAFLEPLLRTPAWVDWEQVDAGARLLRRLGRNAADVLLQLSLVGGYRFGGPPDLLVATGGLVGGATVRRLAETQAWAVALGEPGALRPGGEAWRQTVHVRIGHALVEAAFADRWDAARWGRPINQADQASTLGLFDGVPLLGCRALGVPIGRAEARAYLHLWRYVGWLLGVDADFLVDTERERHRLSYHLLQAQAGPTAAGALLARSVVEAQGRRSFDRLPRLRRAWERERLLSMLTLFLGSASMRELGLPRRPPWAHAYLLPLNTWRYRVLGRLPGGRARLERAGARVSRRLLDSYFGATDDRSLADLPG